MNSSKLSDGDLKRKDPAGGAGVGQAGRSGPVGLEVRLRFAEYGDPPPDVLQLAIGRGGEGFVLGPVGVGQGERGAVGAVRNALVNFERRAAESAPWYTEKEKGERKGQRELVSHPASAPFPNQAQFAPAFTG